MSTEQQRNPELGTRTGVGGWPDLDEDAPLPDELRTGRGRYDEHKHD
jgi:hypothetical protein